MNRTYFELTQKAMEVALLAYDFAMNANFCPDVDEETQRYLDEYMTAVKHASSVIFLALTRQMSHDPQEWDINLSIRNKHEVHNSNRH